MGGRHAKIPVGTETAEPEEFHRLFAGGQERERVESRRCAEEIICLGQKTTAVVVYKGVSHHSNKSAQDRECAGRQAGRQRDKTGSQARRRGRRGLLYRYCCDCQNKCHKIDIATTS